ncbi:gustatory receptor for sugar taste 64a-like [Uranotaenia lowii]|uniref:gustatory receptor for sugar taste 64a-like n=1 Tax=Uranotaenia lowii TaxID=190385 RepID=UPI0024785338|nr:gustatory receptor for sugar taste 64a-like [Uranotaenia lowii]
MAKFNMSMVSAFVAFQLFGIFPVMGIRKRDPLDLRFKWTSFRTIFSLLITTVGIVMFYIELERLDKVGANAINTIGIVFYGTTVISMFLMINLARKWRPLAVRWELYDRSLVNERLVSGTKLSSIVRLLTAIFIVAGFFEHLLAKTSDGVSQYEEAVYCHWDVSNFLRYFANRHYSFVPKTMRFNIFILLFFEFCNLALTMTWTCVDLTIILVSVSLSVYFQRFNTKLDLFHGGISVVGEQFWIEIRKQYLQICNLVEASSNLLAPLVIFSCGTNLYLICFHLVTISWRAQNIPTMIKNWYSLVYMIFKTVAVLYSAAMVNETSKCSLRMLLRVPNAGWCLELDRFTNQLRTQQVALSGMGFFSLTKQTMLAMAGTVITYELVMLKVTEDTEGIGYVPPCSKLAFSKDY